MMSFNAQEIKKKFPILSQTVNGCDLSFLDSGASSQKPEDVITAISEYYQNDHANVHRGVHYLSQKATDAYESVRDKVQHLFPVW